MQMPLPGPHGSPSHSFTSVQVGPTGGCHVGGAPPASCAPHPSRPGLARPPTLTHAVAELRVRPVARVAVAGVVRGAGDALAVATDVLILSTQVHLCGHEGPSGSAGPASWAPSSAPLHPASPRPRVPVAPLPALRFPTLPPREPQRQRPEPGAQARHTPCPQDTG